MVREVQAHQELNQVVQAHQGKSKYQEIEPNGY
jgi:hypothetical protein